MWSDYYKPGQSDTESQQHGSLVALFEKSKLSWEENEKIEEQLDIPGICEDGGDQSTDDVQSKAASAHHTYLDSVSRSSFPNGSPRRRLYFPARLLRCFICTGNLNDNSSVVTSIESPSSFANADADVSPKAKSNASDYYYAPGDHNRSACAREITKADHLLDAISQCFWKCSVGCNKVNTNSSER